MTGVLARREDEGTDNTEKRPYEGIGGHLQAKEGGFRINQTGGQLDLGFLVSTIVDFSSH